MKHKIINLLCAVAAAFVIAADANATCGNPGTGTPVCTGVGNPINIVSGNKFQEDSDMAALPGVLGLEIVRYYNSKLSQIGSPTGIMGRGWKLSYETELRAIGNTVQIMRADGTRFIFSRDPLRPSLCSSMDPAHGTIQISRTQRGQEYIWLQNSGMKLYFDTRGKLVQILAPTGAFVTLRYDQNGWLTQVSDPQGRSLTLNYLPRKDWRDGRFRGVQSIDSPVGRFSYSYGNAAPAGAAPDTQTQLVANLVRVDMPDGETTRQYHYEDARHPTLLTGISAGGGQGKVQRISTFGYDINGRANLSMHADGADKITLDDSKAGQTVLTNSLGQKTVYKHGMVDGELRLFEVHGAGCSLCGESNVRYGYDRLGRMNEVTRLDHDGVPLQGTHTEFDYYGRPLVVSRKHYRQGKLWTTGMVQRFEYGTTPDPRPRLIARPSVVPGQEHIVSFKFGKDATGSLPVEVTETGFVPTYEGKAASRQIVRSVRYAYNDDGLRTTVDGPQPNAKDRPGPENSDITHTVYDRKTKLPVRSIAPGNVITEVLERDQALRPVRLRIDDGYAVLTTSLVLNWRGQPEKVTIDGDVSEERGAGKVARTFHYQYSPEGRLTAITDPAGLVTRFQYDVQGRIVGRILPDGSEFRTLRNSEGQVEEESTSINGKRLTWRRFEYDERNRPSEQSDALGQVKTFLYTELNQVARITNSLGAVTQLNYDENGLLIARAVAIGTAVASTMRFDHDSQGQPTQIVDANGVATERRYDDFGRKVFEGNPDRGISLYVYDAADRVVAMIDESHATRRYRYDYAGRLLAVGVDDKPDLLQYRYRGARRIETVGSQDGDTRQVVERNSYRYNAMGQVTSEQRWLAKVDAGSGAIPASGISFETTNTYDDAGRLIEQALPEGHRLRYTYSPGSNVASEISFDDKAVVSDVRQSFASGLTAFMHGNGVLQTFDMDERARLKEMRAIKQGVRPGQGWFATLIEQVRDWFSSSPPNAGEVVYRQINTYDKADRILGMVRSGVGVDGQPLAQRDERFEYDLQDRLVEMAQGKGHRTRFAYDAGGNRVSENVARHGLVHDEEKAYMTTRGSNRLRAVINLGEAEQDFRAWLFHPTGIPISEVRRDKSSSAQDVVPSERVIYSSSRRPVAVLDASGGEKVRYFYNAKGERIAKRARKRNGAVAVEYRMFQDGKLFAEADANGRVTAYYIHAFGRPVAKVEMKSASTLWQKVARAFSQARYPAVYAIHTDHLGTPQVVTDEQQQPVWRIESDAFGKVSALQKASGANFDLNLRLPGQIYEPELGLNYNYYRDYDPNTGRYVTPDPIGLAGGANPYVYVSGNPLNKIDPLGLYQVDMHYYMVFFLGIAAGVPADDARTIALASQYVDDNPVTQPVKEDGGTIGKIISALSNQDKLRYYHFMADTLTLPVDQIHDVVKGNQLYNLCQASATAKAAASDPANEANKATYELASQVFFGEFLHTMADTYAHADRDNTPFRGVNLIGLGTGHGFSNSDPDFTFNHWGYPAWVDYLPVDTQPDEGKALAVYWGVNQDRTLTAERQLYQLLKKSSWSKADKVVSFDEIKGWLEEFNATGESEDYTITWDPETRKQHRTKNATVIHNDIITINKAFKAKLKILGDALKSIGHDKNLGSDKWGYAEELGKANRDGALGILHCNQYSGVILPVHTCEMPKNNMGK